MKRFLTCAAMLCCAMLAFAKFTGTVTDAQGVKYTANDDDATCYVSGRTYFSSADIVIHKRYQGRTVTAIGDRAFYGDAAEKLTSVVIPNTVTSIGNDAFRQCSQLTAIDIPSSVTSIGTGAFLGCSSLTSVVVPSSVTTIAKEAFRSCSALASVLIPNTVTSIGQNAFYGCSCLTSVVIPEGVTTIGYYAFSGCICNLLCTNLFRLKR